MGVVLGTSGFKDGVTVGQRELDKDALIGTRHTFSVTYYVRAFDIGEPEDSILQSTGIPLLRSLSNNAYCVQKVAREISATALLWEVDCHYDSHVDATSPGRPWSQRWSWDSETIEEVIHEDPVTGQSIVNAVGEPLIITAPIIIPILTIERIQLSFSPDVILNYKNRTNLSPFWGAPRYTALMSDIKDDPEEQNGMMVRRVKYVIKFNFKWSQQLGQIIGWRSRLLNHGTKYFKDAAAKAAGVTTTFEDRFRNPTTGNLTIEGYKLTSTNPADFTYLLYHRFREANLNDLNLGPF